MPLRAGRMFGSTKRAQVHIDAASSARRNNESAVALIGDLMELEQQLRQEFDERIRSLEWRLRKGRVTSSTHLLPAVSGSWPRAADK